MPRQSDVSVANLKVVVTGLSHPDVIAANQFIKCSARECDISVARTMIKIVFLSFVVIMPPANQFYRVP